MMVNWIRDFARLRDPGFKIRDQDLKKFELWKISYFILLASVYSNYAIISFRVDFFSRENACKFYARRKIGANYYGESCANVNGKVVLGSLFSFTRALSYIFSTTSVVNTLPLFGPILIYARKFYATVEVHPYIVWCA